MKQEISIWLNLLIAFWIAPFLRLGRLRILNMSLVFMGMDSPLPNLSNLPSFPPLPCLNVHPLHSSFAGYMHLKASSLFIAAWLPTRTFLHQVASVLMFSRLRTVCIYPPHVWCPAYLGPPPLLDSRMSLQNSLLAISGFPEVQRILGQVVLGVSEGWLQGLPWQVLPISRSVIKDWLVFAVLSSGVGFNHSVLRVTEQSASGSFRVLDSGQSWVLGAGGLLDVSQSGRASLLHELEVLRSFFPSVKLHSRTLGNSVSVPLNLFASLSISTEDIRMAHGGEWADIKKNLRRLYELLAINVVDTKEMSEEIKKMADTVSYTSQQVSNNDARIDDTESSLREIHGKVDRIQEDLQ